MAPIPQAQHPTPPRLAGSPRAGRTTGGRAIIEVADNGRGVDPRDHGRIFELFRRSGKQDQKGEGIGLAHVRALARRLGGEVWPAAAPGIGSRFRVTLPPGHRRRSHRRRRHPFRRSPHGLLPPQAVTIVMIEDDEGHARLIEKNLKRAGVYNEVRHFPDGTSALDYLLGPGRPAQRPLLVLLTSTCLT